MCLCVFVSVGFRTAFGVFLRWNVMHVKNIAKYHRFQWNAEIEKTTSSTHKSDRVAIERKNGLSTKWPLHSMQ